MKKVMFAAAVAASMVAFGAGEITSKNIVGYAGKNLQNGATMVGSQFLGIGNEGGAIELQSLKCRNEDSDQVLISTLDRLGIKIKTYAWINYYGPNYDQEAWVDFSTYEKPAEPVYFQPGDALWVEGTSTDNTVTSSGEVGTADVTVTLRNGATMVANHTPVAINLEDLSCRNEDSDQVLVSTLDRLGIKVKTYAWINYYGPNYDQEAWVDFSTYEKPTEPVLFQPGEGLWVEGTSTENKITIPGVEL